MDFVLPEPGSAEMVDLLCRLERARYDNADAWCIVVVDDYTGEVCQACGPFAEPEQALLEAGRQDADWNEHAEPGEGSFAYKIVPFFGPSE